MQEILVLPSSVAEAQASPVADATLVAERVVKTLFDYVSSFVGGNPSATSPDLMIPMGMIAKWYENFVSKVRSPGVGFLEDRITSSD